MPTTRRISLAHLALLVPWVAVTAKALTSVTDNSYLWHVTAGHVQRATGEVLTADPFSFTKGGEPWLTQSWLAEVAYSVAHDVFGIGFTGLMILMAAGVAIGAIGLLAYDRSRSLPTTAIIVVVSTMMLLSFVVPRPVLFTYPLFALLVLVWERRELRWTIPFLMWLWAAIHGSFPIGLLYIGLMVLSRRDWRAWRVPVVAGLVTLTTAQGLGVVAILTDFLTARPYLALMSEWQRPDFFSADLFSFLVGMAILLYGWTKKRIRPADLWILVPFVLIAATASRSVGIAWIALVPLLSTAMGQIRWRWERGFPVRTGTAAGVLIVLLPLSYASPVTIDQDHFPVAAGAHLIDVNTFHDDRAGGYLIYAETFSRGVFIDDRAEFYRERLLEMVAVRTAREPWEPVFERDGIGQTLLNVGDALVTRLKDAGWQAVFEDANFVVLRPS